VSVIFETISQIVANNIFCRCRKFNTKEIGSQVFDWYLADRTN